MILKNKKSISPLITVILLILVALSIIGMSLDWAKNFTNQSLVNISSEQFSKSDIENFISIRNIFATEYTNNNYIVLDNRSDLEATITGYEIISKTNDFNFLNELHFDINDTKLKPNAYTKLDIYCLPKNEFLLKLFTKKNKVISLDLKGSGNLASCNVKFPGNRVLELGDFNYDVNDYVLRFEFNTKEEDSDYGGIFAYRYKGPKNYQSGQRSGIKFFYPTNNYVSFVGSQNGSSYWWGYSIISTLPNYDYNIIYTKKDDILQGCIDHKAWNSIYCNDSWEYPYYDINDIFYNPDNDYKTTIGSAYTGDGYTNYFNGLIRHVEFAPFTEDNNYAVMNRKALEDHYINYDLVTGEYYEK